MTERSFTSVGTSKFRQKIYIGDPFDKMGAITGFELSEAGFYDLSVKYLKDERLKAPIKEIAISKLNVDLNSFTAKDWQFAGTVSVSSGLVGFFDYSPVKIQKTEKYEWFADDNGVFYSGCKDGLCSVEVHEDNTGKRDAVRIVIFGDFETE